MELTIKSKKLGRTVTFSRPGKAYIFVDLNGKEGTLGLQICKGGGFLGSTLYYEGDSQAEFERICRHWWRSYLKKMQRIMAE